MLDDEAPQAGRVRASELTPEQMALLNDGTPGRVASAADQELDGPPVPSEGAGEGVPPWYPHGAPKAPPGRQVLFLRFRAGVTDDPSKGDRTCVCWNLTEADEKLAAQRARGQEGRVLYEMAKQFVRVVDGKRADWENGPACVVQPFWNEIGGKARGQVLAMYAKQHTMNTSEAVDFFANCVAVRTSAG